MSGASSRLSVATHIEQARQAVSALVGRDTDRMDGPACRRAAVESLSENLTDGFVSPVFWYVLGGVPGILLFKIVSTMDSMVGYKTPQYLRFGWCGARLDDVMNYVPARLTWLADRGCGVRSCPASRGERRGAIGFEQHAVLLGPNSGWSEAATAGALERRIVGPIWLRGAQVTDLWVGDPSDPALGTARDVNRALAPHGHLRSAVHPDRIVESRRARLTRPGRAYPETDRIAASSPSTTCASRS